MSRVKSKPKFSILVLALNEEKNIAPLYDRLTSAMSTYNSYEVVVIDNASTDETEKEVATLIKKDSRWRYIRLSKNFTAEGSMAAGMEYCQGDAVVLLLSDLQDPPELIPTMIDKWQSGVEVVYGIVEKRKDDSIFKSLGAKIYYWLIYLLSDIRIPRNCGSIYVLDRKVVNALRQMRETDRYFRGMVHWVGFKQKGIPYSREERKFGKSKAGLLWCFSFAFTAIFSFSAFPLRLATIFGVCVTSASILLAILYFVLWLFYETPSGIMTLILLILFSLGLQAFFMGLIGEYLSRVFVQVKNRPLWIVDRTLGVDDCSDADSNDKEN